ncbi:MAG: hypothetical protein GY780_16385 [bacterium]|nr:hypothetical protein [bacterium]
MKGKIMNSNNKQTMMTWAITLVLVASVLSFGSNPALAWGKKDKDATEEGQRAVNLEKHPPMGVYRGVLKQDVFGAWTLGKRPLSFNKNSRISNTPDSAGGTVLVDGREAKVTAANVGGTLIVRRVTMFSSKELMERGYYNIGDQGDELNSGSSSAPQ